jgi:Hydrogenase maturation factor
MTAPISQVALVMTSGNKTDEPISIGNREALAALYNLADVFLLHNRDILIRADDSVVRVDNEGKTHFLRRARGYAPMPIEVEWQPNEKNVKTSSSLSSLSGSSGNCPSNLIIGSPITCPNQAFATTKNSQSSLPLQNGVKPVNFASNPNSKEASSPLSNVASKVPINFSGMTSNCVMGVGAELKNTICYARPNLNLGASSKLPSSKKLSPCQRICFRLC